MCPLLNGGIILADNFPSRGEISRKLAKEFKETYGELEEKAHRVSDREAETLAALTGVPLEIARVACQIELDGVMNREKAARLIYNEYLRRKRLGLEIPPVPTYEFYFAVGEGRWIEFIWKNFPEKLVGTSREIHNMIQRLRTIEDIEPWLVIKIIDIYEKTVNEYIIPMLEGWLKDHPETTIYDALLYAIMGIHNTDNIDEAKIKLEEGYKKLKKDLAIFQEKLKILESQTTVVENRLERITIILKELESKESLSTAAAGYILVASLPPPKIVTTESDYVIVHTPIPRGGMVGPELATPSDFLERDLKLALRRPPNERDEKIDTSVEKVFKVLLTDGQSPEEAAYSMATEIVKRFKLDDVNLDRIKQDIEQLSSNTNEILDYLKQFVHEHLVSNKKGDSK